MALRIKLAPILLNINPKPMFLLIQWLGLMGGMSLLAVTQVQAQTEEISVDQPAAAAPVKELSVSPVTTPREPVAAAGEPAISAVAALPKPPSLSGFKPTETVTVEPSIPPTATTEPVALAVEPSTPSATTPAESAPPVSAADLIEPAAPTSVTAPAEPLAPSVSVPEPAAPESIAAPVEPVAPAVSANTPAAKVAPKDNSDVYIDTHDYSVGATQPRQYTQPSDVVLTERSTGCQATLQAGQGVPGSLCNSIQEGTALAKPARTAFIQPGTGAVLRQTGGLLSKSVMPKVAFSGSISAMPSQAAPDRYYSGGSSSGSYDSGQRTYRSAIYRGPSPLKWLLPNGKQIIFPLVMPAPITSAFGWRLNPVTGLWRMHSGTDLGAPMGTPVVAALAGKVAIANFLGGYGLSILLDHNGGKQETRYAHLSEIFVKPGEWVKQGTVIGLVGSTGNSTGPHLHFEVLQSTPDGMVAIDPGAQLEFALAQLVKALQTAQSKPQAHG